MAKPAPILFQPAPRPQPRLSPEQTKELAEATRDLGFGRTTSQPDSVSGADQSAVEDQPSEPLSSIVSPKLNARKTKAPLPLASTETTRRAPALKFDVPDEVWNSLRHEALNRRVTVRYLVLEALAAKGYPVDLTAIHEDGRRLR